MTRIGLQLYTVRDALARDPEGTQLTVANLGYDGVELFGDFRDYALLDELGLEVAGAHVGFDDDLDGLPPRVALAWIDPVETLEERDAAVERIVAFGTRARDAGLEFGFHNHWAEVRRFDDGASLLDLLPDWIWLELDLGWVWHAGADPLELLEWARGRTPNVHLKDFRARETHEFVPVGDGGVGYDRIVPRAIELGVEWLIVEQDQLDRPVAEALERSLAAVRVTA
jgi:sugar phosphate isomerase/epimerase